MKEKNTFTVINDEGKEIVCDVLFTFDSEETKKSYIAYTDNTYEADGSIKAYAAVYHPEDLNKGFEPIETEKEWKVVETILQTIQEEVRTKMAQSSSTDNNSNSDNGGESTSGE